MREKGMTSIYFTFQEPCYRYISGTAIGLLLSLGVANNWMGTSEPSALEYPNVNPGTRLRYVNVIWKKYSTKCLQFLQSATPWNQIHNGSSLFSTLLWWISYLPFKWPLRLLCIQEIRIYGPIPPRQFRPSPRMKKSEISFLVYRAFYSLQPSNINKEQQLVKIVVP